MRSGDRGKGSVGFQSSLLIPVDDVLSRGSNTFRRSGPGRLGTERRKKGVLVSLLRTGTKGRKTEDWVEAQRGTGSHPLHGGDP